MTVLQELYWREPLWLLLAFLPLLAHGIRRLLSRRTWRRLADASLLPWVQAGSGSSGASRSRVLLGLSWALFCIGLAGPRMPAWIPPELQPGDAGMVAVIDFSASMRVADGRPDRIGIASELLRRLSGTAPSRLRAGIVVYAGHAHRVLVPTDDPQLFQYFLGQLPALQPPTLGNNLAAGLKQAAVMLRKQQQPRHLLIFTDGDLGKDALAAARQVVSDVAGAGDIRFHWIGVGSDEQGIVTGHTGDPLVIDGRRITSRRQGARIQRFAALSNGSYQTAEQLRNDPSIQLIAMPSGRIQASAGDRVLWNEYFGVPVLAAILLLLVAVHHNRRAGRHALAILIIGLFLGGCQPAGDPPLPATVVAALASGDYARARELSTPLRGYRARYAEGTACYRLADYVCAIRAFERAAWHAPDRSGRGQAAFNLGLAHFRQGHFEQASVLFRDAQLHGVDTRLTRINRAFADSLAEGVRKRLADIAETGRRAEWRIAAGRMPEGFEDRVADGISLSRPGIPEQGLSMLTEQDLAALLKKGVQAARVRLGTGKPGAPGAWVRSPQEGQPLDTAGLMNALMTTEVGLPARPEAPLAIQGQRPW